MSNSENRFKSAFKEYACFGDKISAYIGGVDFIVRIHEDYDAGKPDERQDGFWPSQDLHDPGYVRPDKYESEMKHAKNVMAQWKAGNWFFCGLILTVEKNDEIIEKHAESLWGLECNYPKNPNASGEGYPNSYLTEVANELLDQYFSRSKT